jgi:diacylglycerol kinase family enzyme
MIRFSPYVRPAIVQIPLGTGNALFNSLHKPAPALSSIYVQALRTLFFGTPKPLPNFKATFSPGARLLTNEGRTATPLFRDALYGAVVASYGFHSTLVADSDTTEWRKHGAKRFGLVANQLLSPPHTYKASIKIKNGSDETVLERTEHSYILASMVSNLEKTFTISPLSTPLGKFISSHVVSLFSDSYYANGDRWSTKTYTLRTHERC